MHLTAKTRNGRCDTAVASRFSSLLTADLALFTSSAPLFPRNPLFPRLRSGHPLFQRPSPGKQIPSNRTQYYAELGYASRSTEITGWLEYFGKTVIEAQDYSLKRVEFLIHKTKFFERYRGKLNQRQEKAMLRIFREGIDGFEGGLSSKNYVSITQSSPATATRDLSDLVEKGAMTRTGENKHARYFLNIPG